MKFWPRNIYHHNVFLCAIMYIKFVIGCKFNTITNLQKRPSILPFLGSSPTHLHPTSTFSLFHIIFSLLLGTPLSSLIVSAFPKPEKMEGSRGTRKQKSMEASPLPSPSGVVTLVQLSIIMSDALLGLECENREGLLLDVMQMLREIRIEATTVQLSINNEVFVAELRAKVKENPLSLSLSLFHIIFSLLLRHLL